MSDSQDEVLAAKLEAIRQTALAASAAVDAVWGKRGDDE
jgi:hypothetical protein